MDKEASIDSLLAIFDFLRKHHTLEFPGLMRRRLFDIWCVVLQICLHDCIGHARDLRHAADVVDTDDARPLCDSERHRCRGPVDALVGHGDVQNGPDEFFS